jgi:transposase-like protein
MFFKDLTKLLDTERLPIETGYRDMQNGQMRIAVLTRMPGCKARWVEWWLKANAPGQKEKFTVKESKNKKILSLLTETPHSGRYIAKPKLEKLDFKWVSPSSYFDSERLRQFKSGAVLCHEIHSSLGITGITFHVIRNTEYGCEMRSHFLIDRFTEQKAKALMDQFIVDMGNLADYLKIIFDKIKMSINLSGIACKFCFSDEVVKNGVRKSGQFWRCKSCGHSFMDNRALPKMRYSVDVITEAVNKYLGGDSVENIRNNIDRETNQMPSSASVYRWLNKLANIK